jgi:hypothetical protein
VVAAAPPVDVVPAPVPPGVWPPGVWVCCVDTEPWVGGSSRDGGKTSVPERLGVTGPLGLGVRAGAPLPTLPPGDVVVPDVDAPPDVEDPDDVWASAAGASKPRANVARIADLMPAPSQGNVATAPSFRWGGMASHPCGVGCNAIDDGPHLC